MKLEKITFHLNNLTDFAISYYKNLKSVYGKNKKRKSNSSSLITKENQLKEIQFKKRFYNQMEILNRQSLPLHKDFEKKVQKYFLKKSKD